MTRWRWLRMLGASLALVGAACSRTGLRGGASGGGGSESAGASGLGGAAGTTAGASGGAGTAGSAGTVGSAGSAGTGGSGAPVSVPLEVLPEKLPDARVRWSYGASLRARGGEGSPFSFELLTGPLPVGVTLSSRGALAGTPQKVGDYPLRVQVTDAQGGVAARDYVLRVVPPRFVAYTTFLSSSSTRVALHLADLTTRSLKTHTLADGSPSSNAFSPDGRWFAFCDHVSQGAGKMYLVDTSGEEPGPLVPMLAPGETSQCAAWVWSPDSRHLAYVSEGWLWLSELDQAGVAEGPVAVHPALPHGLGWPTPGLVFFRDDAGRGNLVRLDAEGGGVSSQVTLDEDDSTILSVSPNGALALARGVNGYSLMDGKTGAAHDLAHWPVWYVSPTLELLLGRSASGEFAIYAPTQASLPSPLRSEAGNAPFGFAAFAKARPALAQPENAQLVVSERVGDTAQARSLSGTYDVPLGAEFDSEDRVLVFNDRAGIWACDTSAEGALTASSLSQLGPDARGHGPTFDLGRSTPLLLAGGGAPYQLRLIDFRDPKNPLHSPVGAQLEWSESVWSQDDTHLTILGGSQLLGRVLYLVTPDRPQEPITVISCNSSGGAVPRCPGSARFQP